MTGNGTYELQLARSHEEYPGSALPARVESPGLFSNTITMRVYDALFDTTHYKNDRALQLVNLVHEQAHVWDAATGGAMSDNMMKATGSYYEWFGFGSYVPVDGPSSTYIKSHREDWAETVAAAVYPRHERYFNGASGKAQMGTSRRDYIRPFLPHGEIFTAGL